MKREDRIWYLRGRKSAYTHCLKIVNDTQLGRGCIDDILCKIEKESIQVDEVFEEEIMRMLNDEEGR